MDPRAVKGENSQIIERELQEILWLQEHIAPIDPNLEAIEPDPIDNDIEPDFRLTDFLDSSEIAAGAESLFASLSQCWEREDIYRVQKSLSEHFGGFVPDMYLETIAKRAVEIRSVNLRPTPQLVECVKPLVSGWTEEDLRLFASSIVATGQEGVDRVSESAIKLIQLKQWQELSARERVAYLMTIAQYAIVATTNSF